MIENAAKGEVWMFRNFYAIKDDKEIDIFQNGGLSCAAFTSSILYFFNSTLEFMNKPKWIANMHANTRSVEKDILQHGWIETKELKVGAILVWEELNGYPHIGFYVGNEKAVSNDSRGKGFPHKHHYTYNDTRKIEKIYWHPELDND